MQRQQLGEVGGLRLLDLFAVDDHGGGQHLGHRHRVAGGGHHHRVERDRVGGEGGGGGEAGAEGGSGAGEAGGVQHGYGS